MVYTSFPLLPSSHPPLYADGQGVLFGSRRPQSLKGRVCLSGNRSVGDGREDLAWTEVRREVVETRRGPPPEGTLDFLSRVQMAFSQVKGLKDSRGRVTFTLSSGLSENRNLWLSASTSPTSRMSRSFFLYELVPDVRPKRRRRVPENTVGDVGVKDGRASVVWRSRTHDPDGVTGNTTTVSLNLFESRRQ